MRRPTFTEALEGVLGALRDMPCHEECGVGSGAKNPMAHNPECPCRAAGLAMARWNDRQRLRDDEAMRRAIWASFWGYLAAERRDSRATITELADAIDNHLAGGTAKKDGGKES